MCERESKKCIFFLSFFPLTTLDRIPVTTLFNHSQCLRTASPIYTRIIHSLTHSLAAVITLPAHHLLSREAATIQAVACTLDDAASGAKMGVRHPIPRTRWHADCGKVKWGRAACGGAARRDEGVGAGGRGGGVIRKLTCWWMEAILRFGESAECNLLPLEQHTWTANRTTRLWGEKNLKHYEKIVTIMELIEKINLTFKYTNKSIVPAQ